MDSDVLVFRSYSTVGFVENYAEERLHEVKDEEVKIRKEESKVVDEIQKLQWNEELLKETLDFLKGLQKEKERNA